MEPSNLEVSLRQLKSNGITKGVVASEMGITAGHLSKLISGEKNITERFIVAYNKKYGHIAPIGNLAKGLPGRIPNEITPEMAVIKALLRDYAEFKSSIVKNASPENIQDEINDKANMLLKALR